jgi:hypothetical protein
MCVCACVCVWVGGGGKVLFSQAFLIFGVSAVILTSGLLFGIAKGCDGKPWDHSLCILRLQLMSASLCVAVPIPRDEALLSNFCDTLAASAERRYALRYAIYTYGIFECVVT